MRITGTVGVRSRVRSSSAHPSRLGIITSVMIRSGGASSMIFKAMWPSAAVCTEYPASMRTVAMTSRTLGSSSTIRMRLTPWCPAAHDALPRTRSLRLHVLGQGRRGVDFLLDVVEVFLDLSRSHDVQPQKESH